ncbi:MAG TPA: TRAP transporter small permease subunit, partial [Synergistaceae bacterium]|nr:TRAP transporter small permease subunit [Synergistaceae bacterium]
MEAILKIVDAINRGLGKIMSFFILPLIFILCYEVVMRYFFNSPTIWAHEISGHIFGMYAVLGGGYVMLNREHIKSDVLYAQFSERNQAIIDLVTFPLIFFLLAVIFVEGIEMAKVSLKYRETTVSFLRSPVYPVK